MRILTFSTLYPNSVRREHGIFVETRLRHLVASNEVEAIVVAPVPWFPFKSARFGEYSNFARVPKEETLNGLRVFHPRYPLIPKFGMSLAPLMLALACLPLLRRLRKEYDFGVIDAHYFYPDGVAAVLLGKWLGKPVTMTARGTDLNLIPQYSIPRGLIKWAAQRAAGLITVCQALKDILVELGIHDSRVRVLRNGVDLKLFAPGDRALVRGKLGLSGPTLLSVGGLIERKGHHLIIEALAQLPEMTLLIAGDGPQHAHLRSLAQQVGVTGRVQFLGALPQAALREYYSAADILVLASSREGWANVLLEAMACGTPVVATKVYGTPEVVASAEAGILVPERSAAAIVTAVRELFARYPDRAATRRYAERFSWDETTRGQVTLLRAITA